MELPYCLVEPTIKVNGKRNDDDEDQKEYPAGVLSKGEKGILCEHQKTEHQFTIFRSGANLSLSVDGYMWF